MTIEITDERVQRAVIKRYVEKASRAKLEKLATERQKRIEQVMSELAAKGYSSNSSARILREREVTEELLAEHIRYMGRIYIEAYERKGLKIGREVLIDLEHTFQQIVGGANSAAIGQAQLTATRTGRPVEHAAYTSLGGNARFALKETEADIDLYNLTPKKAEPMSILNISYHLSGTGNRLVQGDDNSVNTVTINEKELFDSLAAAITAAEPREAERRAILEKLGELKSQNTKREYLALVPKFITAAASVGHVIAPYLAALIEKAEQLAH